MQKSIGAVCAALMIVATVGTQAASAVPVLQQDVTISQPSGDEFVAVPYGDEWSSGYETVSGYTIVQSVDGFWYYATAGPEGALSPSPVKADAAPPSGMPTHLRDEVDQSDLSPAFGAPSSTPELATGDQPTLVLLVSFLNRAPQTSAADWVPRFFGATNSIADFYDFSSDGALSLEPVEESHGTSDDGIVGWLPLAQNHPNTAGSTGVANQNLTKSAIQAADVFVDFDAYDTDGNNFISANELHVVVVAAGNETAYGGPINSCVPSLWAHHWSMTLTAAPVVDGVTVASPLFDGGYTQFGEMHCDGVSNHQATVGVVAHEMGHDIGLPDLYDIDGSSNGIGLWSIMAGGAWLDNGGFAGSLPSLPDAFSRIYSGWASPTVVSTGSTNHTVTPTSILQILNNPGGLDWIFGSAEGSGEYFLVESRVATGWDAGLPACGALVWHIDETADRFAANADDSGRLVDLEEADGLDQLDNKTSSGDAGDPYPGSTDNFTFGPGTDPGSSLNVGGGSGATVSFADTCNSIDVNVTFDGSVADPKVCDFNADGFGDIGVGTPGEDLLSNSAQDAGGVVSIPGWASGLNTNNSSWIDQNKPGISDTIESFDQFGVATTCGDFDGDGFHDLAIGANGEAIGAEFGAGAVTVVYGSSTGLNTLTSDYLHQDRPGIRGSSEIGDSFGEALAAGDFDGDGFTDLAVGIPGEDIPGVVDAGAVQIFYGAADGLGDRSKLFDAKSAGVGGTAEDSDFFGASLAAGDFDDDGHQDLLVGIPGEDLTGRADAGAVQAFYGAASGISFVGDKIFHQNTPGVPGAVESDDVFGWSVAAGDVNGDGKDDVLVGVPGEDIGSKTDAGAVIWIKGSGSGLTATGSKFISQNSPGINNSSEANDLMGWAVVLADFSGDGYADIGAGLPGENTASGAVQIILGSASGPSQTDQYITQNSAGVPGASEGGDFFGSSLTSTDANHDGKFDLVLGAYGEAIGSETAAGAITYFPGAASGITATGSRFISQNTPGVPGSSEATDFFGYSSSGLSSGGVSAPAR